MQIEDLKIFSDVARLHSMNLAAEENYTTPQNLSKIIKRIENEIGVVLFKRSKKGSELTEAGNQFFVHINKVLKYYDEATKAVSANKCFKTEGEKKTEKLSVLCTVGALSCAVMDAYNELLKLADHILLMDDEINFSCPEKILECIQDGGQDIIVCYVPQNSITFLANKLTEYLFVQTVYDELVLVVSRKHSLRNRSQITTKELNHLNVIGFKDFALPLTAFGVDIKYRILTNSHSKALEQVAQSDSYCTMLFKSYCIINGEKFGCDGNLKMIRLDQKAFGAYLIAVNKERISVWYVVHFIDILLKKLEIQTRDNNNKAF